MNEEVKGRAKGGKARAEKLSPEKRREIAKVAAAAKAELAKLPKITHEGEIKIGETTIPCYVTEDGNRVLSGRALQIALSLTGEERGAAGDRVDRLLSHKTLSPLIIKNKPVAQFKPIKCRYVGNPKPINGYSAEVLADICEGMLEARDRALLNTERYQIVARQCEVLLRGFARIGIIALVDEATGYQKDRARDALAKILEAYVTKELQPWVRTFDPDYYEQMFRLRGLPYPPEKVTYRPAYFGHLTNDIVYSRLAPGVLSALKDEARKDEKKGTKLFQHLTAGYGRQELLKHLGMVVGLMKISTDWKDFMQKINKVAARYNETMSLDLDEPDR